MVLRPKPPNRPPMVLRPKPPNRSTHVTTDLDRPSSQVVRAPRSTCAPGILSQSTRSLHVFLRPSMSQVSATTACHPAIWSVSPSLTSALHRSRSISTARPPWPSPRRRLPDPQLSTCTTRTKKTRRSTHRSVPVTNSRSNCTKEIENRMKMLPLTITHHNKLNTNGKCVRRY